MRLSSTRTFPWSRRPATRLARTRDSSQTVARGSRRTGPRSQPYSPQYWTRGSRTYCRSTPRRRPLTITAVTRRWLEIRSSTWRVRGLNVTASGVRLIATSVPSKSRKSLTARARPTRPAISLHLSKMCSGIARRAGPLGPPSSVNSGHRLAGQTVGRFDPDFRHFGDQVRGPAVHVVGFDLTAHVPHADPALLLRHLDRDSDGLGQLFDVVRVHAHRVAQFAA